MNFQRNETDDLRERSISAILERIESRRGEVQEFPPDFVHGSARLEELYEVWGEEWVEQAAFVRCTRDESGRMLEASVARFDDYFLCIEHSGPVADAHAWLESKLGERGTIIELVADDLGEGPVEEAEHEIVIQCQRSRLTQLEVALLDVTRDFGVATSAEPAARRRTAQTDLLSLVCLTARLGAESLH